MLYFKVNLSSGDPVRIDEAELADAVRGIAQKSPAVVCKRGVFNAAYYVSITIDRAAVEEESMRARSGMQTIAESEGASPFVALLGGGKIGMLHGGDRQLVDRKK